MVGEPSASVPGESGGRLDQERNVWLTTVRPDGRPHVTPVWFVFVDERFWIGTGATAVKVRNAVANPAVVVNLESGDDPLVAEGLATRVARPFAGAVVEAFAGKYGWDLRAEVDAEVGEIALLRIDITRWLMGRP